jgi:hypothetical protein
MPISGISHLSMDFTPLGMFYRGSMKHNPFWTYTIATIGECKLAPTTRGVLGVSYARAEGE